MQGAGPGAHRCGFPEQSGLCLPQAECLPEGSSRLQHGPAAQPRHGEAARHCCCPQVTCCLCGSTQVCPAFTRAIRAAEAMWPGLPGPAPSSLVSIAAQAAGRGPSAQASWAAGTCMTAVAMLVLNKQIFGGLHMQLRHTCFGVKCCTCLHHIRVWVHRQVVHPVPTLCAARMMLPAFHLGEGLRVGAGAPPDVDASPAHVGDLPKRSSLCCIWLRSACAGAPVQQQRLLPGQVGQVQGCSGRLQQGAGARSDQLPCLPQQVGHCAAPALLAWGCQGLLVLQGTALLPGPSCCKHALPMTSRLYGACLHATSADSLCTTVLLPALGPLLPCLALSQGGAPL